MLFNFNIVMSLTYASKPTVAFPNATSSITLIFLMFCSNSKNIIKCRVVSLCYKPIDPLIVLNFNKCVFEDGFDQNH